MIGLPSRGPSAKTGSELGQLLLPLFGQGRDDYFCREIVSGNIPDCCRNLVPITVEAGGNTLQYFVSGDVLSVGSNEDYLRISLNGKSAKKLFDTFDLLLPTKKMCDDIWRLADLKLEPRPMGASPNMMMTSVLVGHNTAINQQLAGREFKLLTGHKKDTVLAKHLLEDRSRCAIYGWFHLNGQPIQDLQTIRHDVFYQDYSQSIRIVSRSATLNDQPIDLFDLINNPQYTYLVNEEVAYDPTTIYT